MLKHAAIILLLLFSWCFNSSAQKENNIWVGGTLSGLDFNSGSPVPFARPDDNDVWRTNASICDKNGNLLFYTNGFRVFNRNFQIMQNGDNLNIGDYINWGNNLLPVANGAAIIPIPGDSGKYYLFHTDLNLTTWDTFVNVLLSTHLMYSVIDMNLNGGLGGVISGQKNIVILSDTLVSTGFKIVKHANGRDYWLICHEAFTNRFYRFLIDPYGIHGPFNQDIGQLFDSFSPIGFSTSAFNSQANEFVQFNLAQNSGEVYDFDRCLGELSNRKFFLISDTGYGMGYGEFSPNGKYLYVTSNNWKAIWQYDITAPNILGSRQLAAWWDGIYNPFPTNFYGLRLGPDNKIYVHSYDSNFSIHVINYPDSLGVACGFAENAIQIQPSGWDWNGFPNIVNYSLGPLWGACDTISAINYPESTFTWSVYPNPFSDEFQLSVTGANSEAEVSIYNIIGQQEFYSKLKPQNNFINQTISLRNYSTGVYIVSVTVNGNNFIRKIIKQ